MAKGSKGFSLIELLIVVAIILVIAAIAIPNFMRSRMAANESSAVGSMRAINTGEVAYNTTYPSVGFTALLALGGTSCSGTSANSAAACLVDNTLAGGTKSGYSFTVGGLSGTPYAVYTASAEPLLPGQSGKRDFCSDQSGVIFFGATSNSCTLGTNPI